MTAKRRGIILAGGSGTRLYPITRSVSKQLLPIFDKPLIYYPMATLMLAGIRDILIITRPEDQSSFQAILGDGSQWGIAIDYAVQPSPDGLAQALIIGEDFLDGAPSTLILGDNVLFGQTLRAMLIGMSQKTEGATIFGYRVTDPWRYGVIQFDHDDKPLDIIEKPADPPSNFVVPGIYFYDSDAPAIARDLKPSPRGELEITDLNKVYLAAGRMEVKRLGRGFAWFDAGTHDSLLQAAEFVRTVQERQGFLIACPEEIALLMNWIDVEQVAKAAHALKGTKYGTYLDELVAEDPTWRYGEV